MSLTISSARASRKFKYFLSVFISSGLIVYCLHHVEFDQKIIGTSVNNNDKSMLNVVEKQQSKPAIFNKVQEMNVKLENIRMLILKVSNFSDPVLSLPQRTLVNEDDPHYLEIINNFSCVTNVNLTWNTAEFQDSSHFNKIFNNVLIYLADSRLESNTHQWLLNENYYRFTGSQLLCEWIKNDNINFRYGYIYNYTCNTDIKLASIPTQVEPLLLNSRSPTIYEKGTSPPPHRFEMPTLYQAMQIFTRSVISEMGEPFCGGLQVRPHDCLPAPSSQPSNSSISTFPHYAEVFVISQRWGEGYFHRMIENIPRTALFLDFLRKYPSIKILARDNSQKLLEILETLGLSRDRVITGWIRADIAYVPRTTSCGTPNMIELQFFQYHSYQFIARNLLVQNDIKRNNLILIKRSGRRHFTNHTLIEQLLNKTSKEFGFNFVVFGDNPPPSLNETMILFSLASIVVASHGAGLSNLVFGRPGTLVIEGLCNKPHTNLCYQRTAYALGMRWHGIPSLSGCEGVVDVDGEEIDFILRSYIRLTS